MIPKFINLLFLLLFGFGFVYGQDSTARKKQRSGIAAMPMINYNRTQGIIVGALVSKYFKVSKKDTISPSSNIGFFGMYTGEKSYAAMGFSKFYFDRDRWRVTAAIGTLDINFQYYLEDPTASTGNFFDYSTQANLLVLQVQRNIFKRLYFGPTSSFIKSTTTFGFPDVSGHDSVSKSALNNIGYIITNDTRNHVQYPSRGMFLNFKNQFYRNWIGSDFKFERYLLTYNQFFKLRQKNEKQVLAVGQPQYRLW